MEVVNIVVEILAIGVEIAKVRSKELECRGVEQDMDPDTQP